MAVSITAYSSLAEIKAAYLDNASYEEDGSAAKARRFITACRALLLKLPKQVSMGSGATQLSPELIFNQMQQAQGWLSVNDTATNSGVRHMSLEGFRR